MNLSISHNLFTRVIFSSLCCLLAIGLALPFSLRGEELPPAIAEYEVPGELEGSSKEVYLDAFRRAAEANPGDAADIGRAALQFKFEDIKKTPGLAQEIVLAVITGLTDPGADAILDILEAAFGVLKGLPVDLGDVPGDVLKAVFATLPPEIAGEVGELLNKMPQGAFRELALYIFTTPPTGGQTTDTVKAQNDALLEKEPPKTEDQPVTPTLPQP